MSTITLPMIADLRTILLTWQVLTTTSTIQMTPSQHLHIWAEQNNLTYWQIENDQFAQSLLTKNSMPELTDQFTQTELNPITPMSDQDRILPDNIVTISTRSVVRIKENINLGIISWSNTKFSELILYKL